MKFDFVGMEVIKVIKGKDVKGVVTNQCPITSLRDGKKTDILITVQYNPSDKMQYMYYVGVAFTHGTIRAVSEKDSALIKRYLDTLYSDEPAAAEGLKLPDNTLDRSTEDLASVA